MKSRRSKKDRRTLIERRIFSYTCFVPERRSVDRRQRDRRRIPDRRFDSRYDDREYYNFI